MRILAHAGVMCNPNLKEKLETDTVGSQDVGQR